MAETEFERSINLELRERFELDRNEKNLSCYFMSEIVFFEDFYSGISLVENNLDLLTSPNLIFIATELSSNWMPEESKWISLLCKQMNTYSDMEKSVAYYLISEHFSRDSLEFLRNLKMSVKYVGDNKFVRNRLKLAELICDKETALRLAEEAMSSFVSVNDNETLKTKPTSFWLDEERWINEYILGIDVSDVIFQRDIKRIENVKKRFA